MSADDGTFVGFTCAYTPLPLIDAAGLVPYRILPLSDASDRAGAFLHDNVCPHVKRVVDRVVAGDVPALGGVVVMNSCDTMRRLADVWPRVQPEGRVILVDLPVEGEDASVAYFAEELARLAEVLSGWTGRSIGEAEILESIKLYNELAGGLDRLRRRAAEGVLSGGWGELQKLLNESVTGPPTAAIAKVNGLLAREDAAAGADSRVPVLLFGNVLPAPEAFDLFESCGCRISSEDLCTGSRQITTIDLEGDDAPLVKLARGILRRPICGRTLTPSEPGRLARQVVEQAKACGARGVIAHVMKFCDPYLARLPGVREALREAGLPLLVLEGDCTMRSLGQHRTRIEAFVEMLGG
ncbi:MAG: 2-hydroxyacyl-CoA dehydratase [Phycisphaerae bacterium]|nr:2-hydroxyacyl-CoA dehydratase [Phycisphaerae bacterium]